MDKIYSRKRLLIPKLKARSRRSGIRGTLFTNGKASETSSSQGNQNIGGGKESNYNKGLQRKLIKTAIIVIIAVCIANRIIATIEPIMDVLCIDMAKSIATRVSNEQATNVMR